MVRTLKSKINQAIRLFMVNTITRYNDSILIVEYPKSGGTWLGQLISSYLKKPFPRNKIPGLKSSVFHSHYLPKFRIGKSNKIVYLVRDGRDVIVSLYFHQLIWSDKNRLNPKDVLYHRKQLNFDDFDDAKTNMAEFIKYTFESNPSKLQHFTYMGNWADFNKAWLKKYKKGDNVYLVKYEDMLNDTHSTIKNMFETFFKIVVNDDELNSIVKKFSFENQTKRKSGEEDKTSFLRKGIQGDWKNYFGKKEKALFKKYTGSLLVEFGYEDDQKW